MDYEELRERFPIREGKGEILSIGTDRHIWSGYVYRSSGHGYNDYGYGNPDDETMERYTKRAEGLGLSVPVPDAARVLYEIDRAERMAELSINLSSEISALIKAAAFYCDRYSSDIAYDIRYLQKLLSEPGDYEESMFFGFRDSGVDHAGFVALRAGTGTDDEIARTYLSLWRLDVEKKDGEITTMLSEVWIQKCITGGDEGERDYREPKSA